MLFRLVRPVKRTGSSHHQFVQRIPRDVRSRVVGMTLRIPLGDGVIEKAISAKAQDVRFSLGTANPPDVKARTAVAQAYLESVWEGVRNARDNGPIRLRQDQIAALSGELYTTFIRAFDAEPGSPERWKRVIAEVDEAMRSRVPLEYGVPQSEIVDPERAAAMERAFGRSADELLATKALIIDTDSRARLLEAIARVKREVALVLERRAGGDYAPDPGAAKFPAWQAPATASTAPKAKQAATAGGGKTSLTGILADWWKEAQATGRKLSTYESYSHTVDGVVAFLGHDDATRVTPEDVVGFKDHRLASVSPRTGKPISPKTVKDSDLAALKTLFGWAVANKRLPGNPTEGITIKLGKRRRTRPPHFTDEEAKALLVAADAHQQGRENPKTFAAKRWVPWLCAYTGSRVGEMVQLRKQDVKKQGDLWVIHITPEAGTVKTDEARDVVMHEHLVEKGFPTFVQSSPDEYLFITPKRGSPVRGPLRSRKNDLIEHARETVKDPNVAPNHGWRHRFKTVGMEAGIDHRVLDAIQGQSARTVAETYGEVTLKTQALAMAKLSAVSALETV
ncbi:MAG: tyrosine-type recombinase/integrase [Novosphingobium sp.]|jgi:integrase|uniref:tyrosine-type recombinase/integrase n=1 Tax=Novosphingobium sp. TaxID=1874826 RepID=UPI0022C16464|nr:tyrosine-type recombinase/integrase [Novosphingobium sp.]MCZ8036257.1 tyrosine-type recombinase/integrase [Novosphingobium sp.]